MITCFRIIDLKLVIHYLELCITRNFDTRIIFFMQKTYIEKILERFEIYNTKNVNTFIVKKKILIYEDPSYQVDLLSIT